MAGALLSRVLRAWNRGCGQTANGGGGSMNHGPLIFLGVFAALALSWFGLIFEPQLQLGTAQQATNLVNNAELYPQMRPGLARQGLEVYRSLGCAACHTEQIGQTGRIYDVVL